MTSVKNMPRQQQKAVFARMTDDNYLKTLEGAEKASQRRQYLLKKQDLSESYEDKIFNIYNNSKLTHRQKMDRIARLKKEAKGKLNKFQSETSGTVAGEIREDNLQKFNRKYNIKEVPVNSKRKTIAEIAEAPTEKLIEKRLVIEKRNEVEARQEIKEGLIKLQGSIKQIGKGDFQKSAMERRGANIQIRKGRQDLRKAIINKRKFQKALAKTRKGTKELTKSEAKKLLVDYHKRESSNYHNENAVVLINRFGTKKEKTQAAKKMKVINKRGYTLKQESDWMTKVGHKHYYKLKNKANAKFSKDPAQRKKQINRISKEISSELKEIEKEE